MPTTPRRPTRKSSEAAVTSGEDVYVAKDSFVTEFNGQEVRIHKGVDRVAAGHPILVGREHLFERAGLRFGVEQATAAPGEQREAFEPTVIGAGETTGTQEA